MIEVIIYFKLLGGNQSNMFVSAVSEIFYNALMWLLWIRYMYVYITFVFFQITLCTYFSEITQPMDILAIQLANTRRKLTLPRRKSCNNKTNTASEWHSVMCDMVREIMHHVVLCSTIMTGYVSHLIHTLLGIKKQMFRLFIM